MACSVKLEPDVQLMPSPRETELHDLKHALDNKTQECKAVERKLERQIRVHDQQDAYIVKLEEDQRLHLDERFDRLRSLARLNQKNLALKEQLGVKDLLEWTQDSTRKIAVLLSSALNTEERAAKRTHRI